MGLGAIYTRYKGMENSLEIDVILTRDDESANDFVQKIKKSKYVNNVFHIKSQDFGKNFKRIDKLKNNFLGKLLFKFYYKKNILNIIKSKINNKKYDSIFFSHELSYFLITFLKFLYQNAEYNIYGDGSGVLIGKNVKLINPYKKQYIFKFFKEIKPDNIIALASMIEDDSFNAKNIPVLPTDSNITVKLIKNDAEIQKYIEKYTNEILSKYRNIKNKILLLASRLEDKRFKINQDNQINIYLDIIEKYCPENSLVIIKLHPTSKFDIVSLLKEKCKKNCIFEAIPQSLKAYPVEIYANLIEKFDLVITFISSSRIALSELYKVKTTDAFDVIQKYPLKDRVNPPLEVIREVLNRLPNWDKKSVIYQCDIIPKLIEFYEKNGGYK